MKPWMIIAATLVFASCSGPAPIETRKIPKEFKEFGHSRVDNYAWLSDPTDSAVIRHLVAENTHTEAALRHTEALQQKILAELMSRVEQNESSLPIRRNGYWYYRRFDEGKQYPVHYRRKGTMEAAEEILLNVPELASGHQIYLVHGPTVSPDNAILAYGVDTSGNRMVDLRFRNLSGGPTPPEVIPNTSGEYAWGADSRTVIYAVNDPTVRPWKVLRHQLGADPKTDRVILAEPDSTLSISLSTSRDGRFVFLTSGYTDSREVRYLRAEKTEANPVLLQARMPDLVYEVLDYEGDSFILRTNAGARDFRMVRARISDPRMTSWSGILPDHPGAFLEQGRVFKDFIVSQWTVSGLTQIEVFDRAAGVSRTVPFAEESYDASMSAATDAYDLDSIRISYTSLTTPRSDFLFNLRTGERQRMKQEKVGGGFVDTLYQTHRLWATGPDSVRVPISVVYRTDRFRHDGSNPMLLYAYGSYGISSPPAFNRQVISLLDRGVMFGIAHIRGGQELGRGWYEDGKLLHKKNTFQDFITCAQYLVDTKYTSPSHLFAHGGSAGGMLMGAITNMRPDLFSGILADVPWMDVVTDMLNSDLPLTTLEYDEWGNPAVREQYDYMLSWSPYDNVTDARFPAIFATGGLHDTNVPYYSPAKWVAKVRDHNTGTAPVLLKVNMGAGHGGESGRFERLKLTAMKYAFLLDLAGIKE